MTTSEAAQGRWEEIFTHYKLPPVTGKRHYKGPCPLCGKKNKFRIDDKHGKGSWICVCGSGNGFDLLMSKTGLEYLEICEEVDKITGNDNPGRTIEVQMKDNSHHEELKYFSKMMSVEKSPVQAYLKSRGITIMPDHSVRFSIKEYSTSTKSRLSAMYCVASNYNNKIKYSHCTFLIGSNKANIEAPKQMKTITEYSGSIAVKMFKYKDKLGIAEGVETALSCNQMFNIPTWSVLTSSFMKRFVVPKGVKEFYIFADNDRNGTGLASAFHCGRSNVLKANDVEQVHILWPLKDDSDFNDILSDIEPGIMQWTLKK